MLRAQADAKAKQEAAEAQRRKDEEKIRAGMERARREAEASRTADEQRVRPCMLSTASAQRLHAMPLREQLQGVRSSIGGCTGAGMQDSTFSLQA